MTDIYTTSRDSWGLRLECSRRGSTWTSCTPRALDCLEFA